MCSESKKIELDTELHERLKEVARKRAYPTTAEIELAKAVRDYLDKWEMFLSGNRTLL